MNINNEHTEYCLAEVFQSGMLFQREKEIVLWGKAAPGVTVTASLYREDADTVRREMEISIEGMVPVLRGESIAGQDGTFRITLPPQEAGEGYLLEVTFVPSPIKPVRLDNICFGDLWLAGGQSNMEFFLKYDRDWEQTKKLPRNPRIRMYNTPQRAFEGHTTHNKGGYGYWFDDSDPGLACFSAPAYSFARDIQAATGVPVGIIGCNWGGTTASAWVPEEVLSEAPLDTYLKEYRDVVSGIFPEKLAEESLSAWDFEDSLQHSMDFEPLLYGRDRDWQLQYMKNHAGDPVIPMGPYNINRPSGLYHTMLSGLIPLAIKGVLWYQGESDAGDHAFMYDRLLSALIECWREKWNDDFPFLIVQLAPFGVWLDCDSKGYTVVREKQAAVARNLPEVYMAGIMDLGSYYDIHPKEKMEVGHRLALLARGHVYGEKDLLCDAPEVVSAVWQKDGRIVITLRHGDGLTIGDKSSDWNIEMPDQNVEIHDRNAEMPDQNMQPAQVLVEDDNLILVLPDFVSDNLCPLSVSLGWKDYAEIHIKNRAGLSVIPFKIEVQQGDTL